MITYSVAIILVVVGCIVTAISAGASYTMAIRSDKTLWAWGNNAAGQLGIGDTTNRSSPVQVGSAPSWHLVASIGGTPTTAQTLGLRFA